MHQPWRFLPSPGPLTCYTNAFDLFCDKRGEDVEANFEIFDLGLFESFSSLLHHFVQAHCLCADKFVALGR
jgi:hypothetical protein